MERSRGGGSDGGGEGRRRRLDALLARLGPGVILVSGGGEVVETTALARRVLEEEDGLYLQGRVLRAANSEDSRCLKAMVKEAGRSSGGATRAGALCLSRPSGRRALEVVVLSLDLGEAEIALDAAVAAVLVSDPEQSGVSVELLKELYGLTRTEAEIAAELAGGWSPEEIAGRRGVQANTVRVHLKAVFAKTGTGRQAELVHRILSSPLGILGPEDGAES